MQPKKVTLIEENVEFKSYKFVVNERPYENSKFVFISDQFSSGTYILILGFTS